MGTIVKITCPVCGMNRPAKDYHNDDESKSFGSWNETRAFIQIRDAPGGKRTNILVGTGKYRKTPGQGFPLIASHTLSEAKDIGEYNFYVEKNVEQIIKLMKIFRGEGLISDEDIEAIRAV